jgi:hypothetical protein
MNDEEKSSLALPRGVPVLDGLVGEEAGALIRVLVDRKAAHGDRYDVNAAITSTVNNWWLRQDVYLVAWDEFLRRGVKSVLVASSTFDTDEIGVEIWNEKDGWL